MIIARTIQELQASLQEFEKEGKDIGFVPTMGFLHEGHMELVKESKIKTDKTVMSIFVNPLQFGPNEDFDRYPRDEEKDIQLARNEGVDLLFLPTVEEMYPNGNLTINMVVTKRTDVLCGKSRPGHFDGVATVVAKLFQLIRPQLAFFGLKDAQQVAVIHALVEDYHFPIEIVPVPTVREHDGLAKSSRNVYLSDQERLEAPYLYKALQKGREAILKGDSISGIRDYLTAYIENHTSGEVDYLEIYSYPDLEMVIEDQQPVIIAVAVKFSQARLIDNIIITQKS
ncbi:pantoate--beta-alanine ligase [Bacillus coahuilensis p1.1.43]|uniref:Pantothenate synthetase n=1 Tax=Bacillus coahuilensis p1.1.43 TaxID=1150625 RepID=A0A147K8M5_9BACI|nr:pantoate--beta-alanine ligase [Bacillus coahuilensis]KUP06550.1 pantoate--beta-alanine ligase [Bacillus coahuilensis p1.1.43]